MSYASQAKKSSLFPAIRHETVSRLSTEVDIRMANRARQTGQPKSSWFILSINATVLSMGWPFK